MFKIFDYVNIILRVFCNNKLQCFRYIDGQRHSDYFLYLNDLNSNMSTVCKNSDVR